MEKDFELLYSEDSNVTLAEESKKIRFQAHTFKNIVSHWNNLRLNRLKEKLEEKKEKIVTTAVSEENLFIPHRKEKIGEIILAKTKAIVLLESKINFLENGKYYSEEFISSRAIKLKNTMMDNFRHNMYSLYYTIPREVAEEIMSPKVTPEKENIRARVAEILEEQKNTDNTSDNNNPNLDAEIEKIIAESMKTIGDYSIKGDSVDEDDKDDKDIDILPFEIRERETPSAATPRKELTEINPINFPAFPKIPKPTIKEDESNTTGDVSSIINRVIVLLKERQKLLQQEEEKMETAKMVDSEHRATMEVLSSYAEQIEADCNAAMTSIQQIDDYTNKKANDIEEMNALMEGRRAE